MKLPRRFGLIAAAVIILSGFAYLVYGGLGDGIVHHLTPTELLEKGAVAQGRAVRLGGLVMPGSVRWNAQAIELRFTIQDQGNRVDVHARRAPPAMFREGMGVLVEGKLTPAGIFEAGTVIVKHSNEYRPPAEGEMKPQEMYRSLIREPQT